MDAIGRSGTGLIGCHGCDSDASLGPGMMCEVQVGSVEQEYFQTNWSFDRTSDWSWTWS